MNKFLSTLFLLIVFSTLSFAQEDLKKAEKAYRMSDYYTAIYYFEKAFEVKTFAKKKKSKVIESYFKYAESCRNTFNFPKAETYYKLVYSDPVEGVKYPLTRFHYASALKQLAKYEEAKTSFQEFIDFKSNSREIEKFKTISLQELKSCDLAIELMKSPVKEVNIEALPNTVNTKYSDFAAHIYGGELYYSSLKFETVESKKGGKEKKELFGKLMYAGDLGKKKGMLIPILNQRLTNVGNSALSLDNTKLYYTICAKNEVNEVICKIYVSSRNKDGKNWTKGKILDINNVKGTNTHPHIAYDSLQRKEVMYFVSTREGGQGDMDIWRVFIESDGNLSDPENLGAIVNTVGKEATPFFHTRTQTLYYSSNWHPNLGGYDIFKTQFVNGAWTEPINLGTPMNSAANDIYFYITPNNDTAGYFSSNRPGSKILVGESCCNDIYSVSFPSVLGRAVQLVDYSLPEKLADKNSLITKNGNEENTEEEEEEIVLAPVPTVEENSQVETEKNIEKPITTIENTSSKTELKENKNEENKELEDESNEDVDINDLERMLPISLYFHNDEPEPKTKQTLSNTDYSKSYQSLMSLKPTYLSEYSGQFSDNLEIVRAKNNVNVFFDKVKTEHDYLNVFIKGVKTFLDKNVNLEIQIRGYCSPLSSSDYNKNLAKRRISSLKNKFLEFEKGVLVKYVARGNLKIIELPIGEEEINSAISDDPNDPANSIYSPEASTERRVKIEAIKIVK